MKRAVYIGLVLVLILVGCSQKGPEKGTGTTTTGADAFDVTLSQFKNALAGQDYLKALQLLRSSIEMFWEKSPLLLHNARFVKQDGNSYGMYEPKEGDTFSPGEPVYLYVEPVGFTLKRNESGNYEFGFTGDFSLTDEGGKILGSQNDFANLNFKSWNFNTEVALTFTYTFSGLEKGRYKIITTVKDANSDKKATVESWLNIQ